MAPTHPAGPGSAGDSVVPDVEDEPGSPVWRRQEVLDGLDPLACSAGGADTRVEGDQGSAEVAALRLATGGGAEVAADGRRRPDLDVGEMDGEVGKRSIGKSDQGGHRRRGSDRDAVALDGNSVEAAAVEHQSARRREPAGGDLGKKDGAATEDGHSLAVPEERGRLVGGGRYEHVGSHGRESKHAPRARRRQRRKRLDYD